MLQRFKLFSTILFVSGVFVLLTGCGPNESESSSSTTDEQIIEDGVLFNKDKTILYRYLDDQTDHEYQIPASVNHIVEHAFLYATALESITVHEDNQSYTSLDGILYNKDMTEIVFYPPEKKQSEFIIPSGVTHIGEYVFNRSTSLTTLSVPASVTTFDGNAVYKLESLQALVFNGGITVVQNNFSSPNEYMLIYVPDEFVEEYKTRRWFTYHANQVKSLSEWENE